MPPPAAFGQKGSGSNAPLADQAFWDSFLSRGLAQPAEGQEYHKPFPFAVLELKVSPLGEMRVFRGVFFCVALLKLRRMSLVCFVWSTS